MLSTCLISCLLFPAPTSNKQVIWSLRVTCCNCAEENMELKFCFPWKKHHVAIAFFLCECTKSSLQYVSINTTNMVMVYLILVNCFILRISIHQQLYWTLKMLPLGSHESKTQNPDRVSIKCEISYGLHKACGRI